VLEHLGVHTDGDAVAADGEGGGEPEKRRDRRPCLLLALQPRERLEGFTRWLGFGDNY